MKLNYLLGWSLFFLAHLTYGQQEEKLNHLKSTKGIVALWDFKEPEGQPRIAFGKGEFPLKEFNGPISRLNEGPLSGFSANH